MLIVPIVLLLTEQLKLKPFPFLLAPDYFSNIGEQQPWSVTHQTSWLSAVGLSFTDFLLNMGLQSCLLWLLCLACLTSSGVVTWQPRWEHAPTFALLWTCKIPQNQALLIKSFIVLALVMAGFTLDTTCILKQNNKLLPEQLCLCSLTVLAINWPKTRKCMKPFMKSNGTPFSSSLDCLL